ncbi:efflux transporter periplasmic adaptor subunit, partial [Photobacterium sp. OFAV2-7]|nr:efflux transporter periplasmic adaptor subunit [Photobacterium sp. OFAV2-7]
SRQRSLIVVVEQPLQQANPLYAGTFVEAKVQGRNLSDLWQLPASAISQTGQIWLVDGNNSLFSIEAEKQFEDSNYVYVVPPDDIELGQVVIRPLSSYVQGMFVHPVVEG